MTGDVVDVALDVEDPEGPRVAGTDERWMPTARESLRIEAPENAWLVVRRAAATSTAAGWARVEILPLDAAPSLELERRIRVAEEDARAPNGERRARALAALEAIAIEAEEAEAHRLAARALLLAGRTGRALAEPRARDLLDRGRALVPGVGPLSAALELELGALEASLGLETPALAHLERALEAAPEDPVLEARALVARSVARFEAAAHVEALALARAAAVVAEPLGDPRLDADVAEAIGWPQVRLGQRDEAHAQFGAMLASARAAGDLRREALAHHHLGVIRSNFDRDWAGALEANERAIALAERVGDRHVLAFSLDSAGEQESTLGRASALDRHRRALALRRAIGNLRGEAQSLLALGNALTRLGRPDEALPWLKAGVEKAREAGNAEWSAYAHFRLGRAYDVGGNYPAALEQAERAIAIADSLRERIATASGRTAYADSVRWYFDLAVSVASEQAARDPAPRWVEAALRASERARARALVETLRRVEIPAGAAVPPELVEEKRRLRDEVRSLEAALAYARARGDGAGRLAAREAEILERMAAYARLSDRIDALDPRRKGLFSTPTPSLPEAQALVGDSRTLVVEIYLGAGGTYALVVGTATATAHALGPEAPLDELARQVHADLIARNVTGEDASARARAERIAAADARAREGLRALRSRLFGPFEDRLRGFERVVVVPDGALHYVPFAPLLPEHAVVTLPSLTVLAALREGVREAAPRGLGVVGDPVFEPTDPRFEPTRGRGEGGHPAQGGPDFDVEERLVPAGLRRLRFASAEVDAIAALVPPQEREVRVGFDATRAFVLGGGLANLRLVHFATHGVLDAERPEGSGLVLSRFEPGGRAIEAFLGLGDIYRLRLDAEVVTLSACETALGREVRSEGLVGLTRGFLHAGARRVISSLWKVHDEATRELMTRFYHGLLKEGMSPEQALYRAQRVLADSERFAEPYFWAGFVIHGDWTETGRR